ncbi:MAG: tRNA (N(6)-L-threonylcarbamoyladenosine(37)-C(2))-methylthiotransferase MtaB [Chloroflexi bacterium]|nr:tRNA (N(6)-L-threonylcarbamoyladenosine(37)-C(2))-methylthiotransferase MtaB [Chloroflexota bacterium]
MSSSMPTPTPVQLHKPDRAQPEAGLRGRVVIQTHGCKLNQADSSMLARQFRQSGYTLVEEVSDADIYVLNACTVTATADSKARQSLRAARRANPDAVIVAAGCYPQRAAEELERMPAVSLVVGNQDKESLVRRAISAHLQVQGRNFEAAGPKDSPEFSGESISGNLPGRSRGMVKIQEGCDQVCAYCIVPKVRGRERSIPPQEIVAEVRRSGAEGCLEVALTGTQLGTYGFDIPGASLKKLIKAILDETEIPRLRVSSLQPQEIDQDLLRLWLEESRLCPHFHIPLQSGSDAILKAMRRQYDTTGFAETVSMIRQSIPHAGVTADLIVGFPGEKDCEFEESLAFVEDMRFSDLHIFPYSRRPGTSAAYLDGHLTEAVKKERMKQALKLARRSFQEFRSGQLGTTRPVLWESARNSGAGNTLSGLTDNYIRVDCSVEGSAGQYSGLPNSITLARLLELREDRVTAKPLFTKAN